jgi:hypothetical protein
MRNDYWQQYLPSRDKNLCTNPVFLHQGNGGQKA